MKPLPNYLSLRVAACLSVAFLGAGCSSSDARARDALSDYQAAAAANNIYAERQALLKLVQAKDDVADYWVELGKLDASTGDYSAAYYAFTRAYELDRSNVDVLRAVTQLALRAGDLASAKSHAEELSIVSPGDPLTKITTGWAAITESNFDKALVASDAILATSPSDPSGTVLKARALLGLNRRPEATELLVKQTQAQPSDAGSLQLLARIYERNGDWEDAVGVAQRLAKISPADQNNGLLLAQAAFRSGNIEAGREASRSLLKPNADPSLIDSVLDLWSNYWPSPQRVQEAVAYANAAEGLAQKVKYAGFLNRIDRPAEAVPIVAGSAKSPIDANNAEPNAVLAEAWSHLGNYAPAKSRFDAILAFDPGNATALRGRAELALRMGHSADAVTDAQKLVTVLPGSARDRLLLARSYAAAGNSPWVNRTLWTAFQDIPGDETIFAALATTRRGDPDAIRHLQEEFDRQREAKVGRGVI